MIKNTSFKKAKLDISLITTTSTIKFLIVLFLWSVKTVFFFFCMGMFVVYLYVCLHVHLCRLVCVCVQTYMDVCGYACKGQGFMSSNFFDLKTLYMEALPLTEPNANQCS